MGKIQLLILASLLCVSNYDKRDKVNNQEAALIEYLIQRTLMRLPIG